MDQPIIAAIFIFAGNFNPASWALCQGQVQAISQNEALFNLIGTVYGGDGSTTFNLPDLRGRVPVGQGQGGGLTNRVIGETAGTENVTMTVSQMPAHLHGIQIDTATATTPTPASNTILGSVFTGSGPNAAPVKIYSSNAPDVTLGASSIGNAGGSQPFSILQPFLSINYIIALFGIFPSRN